jgi:hypothetical protein
MAVNNNVHHASCLIEGKCISRIIKVLIPLINTNGIYDSRVDFYIEYLPKYKLTYYYINKYTDTLLGNKINNEISINSMYWLGENINNKYIVNSASSDSNDNQNGEYMGLVKNNAIKEIDDQFVLLSSNNTHKYMWYIEYVNKHNVTIFSTDNCECIDIMQNKYPSIVWLYSPVNIRLQITPECVENGDYAKTESLDWLEFGEGPFDFDMRKHG